MSETTEPLDSMTIGDTVVFNTGRADTVDQFIEQYGFHPAQIVQSADGKDAWAVVDVLRDCWFQAMWRARTMTREEIERWLLNPWSADDHA